MNIVQRLIDDGLNANCLLKKFPVFLMCCINGHETVLRFMLEKKINVNVTRPKDGYNGLMLCCLYGHLNCARLLIERSNVNQHAKDGTTAIMLCSRQGWAEMVQILIAKKAEVNPYIRYFKMTSLTEACCYGHFATAKLLLENKADVNAVIETSKRTSLMIASESGFVDLVVLLCEFGADLHRDAWGRTALSLACEKANFAVAKVLLQRGASRTAGDFAHACKHNDLEMVRLLFHEDEGDAALSRAIELGRLEIVKFLVEEKKVKLGEDSLFLACYHCGNVELADLLISYGANVNGGKFSALIEACSLSFGDLAKMLILAGADVNFSGLLKSNKRSMNGRKSTPLISASRKESMIEIVALLLERKADVNMACEGTTPLLCAAELGNERVAMLLIDNRANVAAVRQRDQRTSLMFACERGRTRLASILIEHGCDVNARTLTGKTALIFASRGGHLEIVQLLIQHNASVSVRSAKGKTAFWYCCANGHLDVVTFLIDKVDLVEEGYMGFMGAHKNLFSNVASLVLQRCDFSKLAFDPEVVPILLAMQYGIEDWLRNVVPMSVLQEPVGGMQPLDIAQWMGWQKAVLWLRARGCVEEKKKKNTFVQVANEKKCTKPLGKGFQYCQMCLRCNVRVCKNCSLSCHSKKHDLELAEFACMVCESKDDK